MGSTLTKSSLYRMATIAIPMICTFVAIGIALFEVHRLHALRDQAAVNDHQIMQLQQLVLEMNSRPPLGKVPAVDGSAYEQSDFLTTLRNLADRNHVQVVRWNNTAANAPPPTAQQQQQQQQNPDPNKKALPSGLLAVPSLMEVSGQFAGDRNFLYGVLRAKRLFSLSDMQWERGSKYPLNHVIFTITRYVSPPGTTIARDPEALPAPSPTALSAALSKPTSPVVEPTSIPVRKASWRQPVD